MKARFIFLLLATCSALVGCTRTWVGSGPILSPDGHFQVQISCAGAYGRSYVAETNKECGVSVFQHYEREPLFRGRYDLYGSDIAFEAHWQSPRDLLIDFFDFGPGMSAYDAKNKQATRRSIRQIHLSVESGTSQVVEKPTV